MLDLHSHGMPEHPAILRRNMEIWDAGLASLRRRVREFQISRDWVEAGPYYAAAGPDGELRLSQIVLALDLLGAAYKLEDRSSLRTRLGTEFYSIGLFAEGDALVNPSALMRGLATNMPSNVSVYEDTPVIDLSRSGEVYLLQSLESQVVADRVFWLPVFFFASSGLHPPTSFRWPPVPISIAHWNCSSRRHLGQALSSANWPARNMVRRFA